MTVEKRDVLKGFAESDFIPETTLHLLSGTSNALDCFPLQVFSRRLQTFLINYRTFVTADQSISDE